MILEFILIAVGSLIVVLGLLQAAKRGVLPRRLAGALAAAVGAFAVFSLYIATSGAAADRSFGDGVPYNGR